MLILAEGFVALDSIPQFQRIDPGRRLEYSIPRCRRGTCVNALKHGEGEEQ